MSPPHGLRWGVLSTAAIVDALLAGGQRFVAVASRDGGRAEAFARVRGIARAHGSYEALLADDEVDAVYVPLPNALHVEWSIRALEAGKHVLCEKPMSRHPQEVERAFAVAERQGLVLAEALMWRHHPQVPRACELLGAGAIGRLRLLRAQFAFAGRRPDDIRLQTALDGGGLMDVGCYCVSGCRALAAAEPEHVHAQRVLGGDGVDVALAATLRLGEDVLATIDCGVSYAGGGRLEALGEEGSLLLTDPWHGRQPRLELRRPGRDVEVEEPGAGGPGSYALQLADFEAAVRGERTPLLGRADALGQARAIAAIHRSAERGGPVAL